VKALRATAFQEAFVGNSQQGLSSFGMLIVLVIAVAAGYYAYIGITGAGDAESCKEAFRECMKTCRRTTTEAPAAQACQEACLRDQAACERRGK
jgi:hypothetical protein